jgi:hypothetical protein
MKEEGAITAPASNEGTPIPTKGMHCPTMQLTHHRYNDSSTQAAEEIKIFYRRWCSLRRLPYKSGEKATTK